LKYFIIFLILVNYCKGEILFQSQFETGFAVLKDSIKPYATSLSVFDNFEWRSYKAKKGMGIIKFKSPPYYQIFHFENKSSNKLEGLKGLKPPIAPLNPILLATLEEWDGYNPNFIQIIPQKPFGNFGAQIHFNKGKDKFYLEKRIPETDEYYLRFEIIPDSALLVSIERGKFAFFHDVVNKYGGIMRMGIMNKSEEGTLHFFLRIHTTGEKLKDVYLVDSAALVASKSYQVEYHYAGGKEKHGGAELWVNGEKKISRLNLNTSGLDKVYRIFFGTTSGFYFSGGNFVLDNVILSTKKIGINPSSPILIKPLNSDTITSSFPVFQTKTINFPVGQEIKIWHNADPYLVPFLSSGFIYYPATSYHPKTPFEKPGNYFWRARVRSKNGFNSPWSSAAEFTLANNSFNRGKNELKPSIELSNWNSNKVASILIPGQEYEVRNLFKNSIAKYNTIEWSFTALLEASLFEPDQEIYSYNWKLDLKSKSLFVKFSPHVDKWLDASGQKIDFLDNSLDPFKKWESDRRIYFKFRPHIKTKEGAWLILLKAEDSENKIRILYKKVIPVLRKINKKTNHKLILIVICSIVIIAFGAGISWKIFGFKKSIQKSAANPIIILKENIEKAIEMEFQNEKFSSSILAQRIRYSQPELSKLFKKVMGKSFPDYLNGKRIHEAKKHLLETDLKISEIAFKVGYNNIEHFNKVFRRYEKQSPGEFRMKADS